MNATSPPVLLLVEDEALILHDMEEALKEAGFKTIALSEGSEALKEIENDCSRFSAMVTDVDLGNGPSGWEVARRARELCPTIAVVYMSGGSAQHWLARGVPKSVMLQKPFAPAQLVTAIATLLNEAVHDAIGLTS